MENANIIELREALDSIDNGIIIALIKRYQLTDEIGAIKKDKGINVYDENRENFILDKILNICKDQMNDENDTQDKTSMENAIIEIYKQIMKQSRIRQGR